MYLFEPLCCRPRWRWQCNGDYVTKERINKQLFVNTFLEEPNKTYVSTRTHRTMKMRLMR